VGLDVAHRQKLLDLLGDLTQKTGVVLVSRPQDEFPSWATDVLVLDNGKVAWQGSPENYLATTHHNDLAKERQEKDAYRTQALADEEARRADRPGVVELNNVNVVYSGQKILDDVTWTVKQGDRWALLGPNGK
jgi:molybdate transport system ATP-binding protein